MASAVDFKLGVRALRFVSKAMPDLKRADATAVRRQLLQVPLYLPAGKPDLAGLCIHTPRPPALSFAAGEECASRKCAQALTS